MVVEQWQIKVDGTPSVYSLPFPFDDEFLSAFRSIAVFSSDRQGSGPTIGRLVYHGLQPDIRLRCSVGVPWDDKGDNFKFANGSKGLKTSIWSSSFQGSIDVAFRNKVTYLTDYEFKIIPKQSTGIAVQPSSIGDQVPKPLNNNALAQHRSQWEQSGKPGCSARYTEPFNDQREPSMFLNKPYETVVPGSSVPKSPSCEVFQYSSPIEFEQTLDIFSGNADPFTPSQQCYHEPQILGEGSPMKFSKVSYEDIMSRSSLGRVRESSCLSQCLQGNRPNSAISLQQPNESSIQTVNKPTRHARKRSQNLAAGIGAPSNPRQSSMIAKGGRANHSKESWEKQRNVIEQLYCGHHFTMAQVKGELDKRGFVAT